VNLKAIFRKNDDRLSMPSSTQNFTLRVYDPTGKAVLEKVSRPNDFGSIVESYVTTQNAPIGNYSVSLSFVSNGQEQAFLFSSFNVQIFKNPTFENTVTLTASGLDAGMIRVTETGSVSDYGWNSIQYKGSFSIDGTITSRFYNGASLDNAKFTYRVYRQPYYDWSYWDNCYYGCYWEPEKTFITEGEGMLEKGRSSFHIDADFASQYDDYKYIVEVTVTDASTGEEITGANSLIVRLPSVYKYWNPQNTITIASSSKFVKSNTEFPLLVTLNNGKWTSNANSLYTYHLY
jgi:uncharacterized protein YfaS (alpha-2-macroglobulin family)